MRIRTGDGGEVPFGQVASVEPGPWLRVDQTGRPQPGVNVSASVDDVTSAGAVIGDLVDRILPGVLATHPGVFYIFEGAQAEQQDAIGGLQLGFGVAQRVIFALLAIPLKSYVQRSSS